MKDTTAEIVFTLPAAMGGVASFNFNLINTASLKGTITTRVILIKAKEDTRPVFTDQFDVDDFFVFEYSYQENQYFVCKRLEKLIGKKKGAVVCDNALTIQCCKLFNNPKTLFHLIHDYFYVKQNVFFDRAIDVAVAHSSFFSDSVFAASPTSFANRIFYIPYGVKQHQQMPVKESGQPLKLFFLGRLDHGKGVEKLIDIENKLKAKAIDVEWTVIGMGKLESEIKQQWNGKTNVSFEKPQSSVDVYNVLLKQDVFVFPTEFEGTPVSIMEALSNANVVIVSDLPGGIRDMVTTDVGYRVSINNTIDFANQLELLHKDRALLKTLQENAWQKAVNNFNAEKNSDKYFELFLRFDEFKRKNTSPSKIRLNYLDKPYFPNAMVKLIRKILSKKI